MAALLNATELTQDYLSPPAMEEAFGPYRHLVGCVAAFCERAHAPQQAPRLSAPVAQHIH
jgi:hypothetical protein